MKNTQKGFSSVGMVGLVALLFIIVGSFYYASTMRQVAEEEEKIASEDQMMDESVTAEPVSGNASADVQDKMEAVFTGRVLAGDTDKLLDFNQNDYEKAIASDKLVVLYFYATWCPICKAEFPRMEQAFDELSVGKVVGFRVNFNDNQTDEYEKDLARQFGVAYQHTKVFLQKGERVLKSPESWDKNKYLQEINKFIK